MNCKRVKFYFLFICLLLINTSCFAQNNNKAEIDSTGINILLDTASDNVENIKDTVVTKIIFDSSKDSILKWKESPEFGYITYLDSLLKRKRNGLRIDTTNIDKSTIGSKNKMTSGASSSNNFLNSFPVKIFFWLIAIFFVGFILYKLFFKGVLFAQEKMKGFNEPLAEKTEELKEYSTYNELIHKAELRNDFNLAIRYLYLQTLKKLSNSELILFSPDKTNRLYVEEFSSNPYQLEFAAITTNYEYAWYGKIAVTPHRYQQIKKEFVSFNKKI